jgi:hypothetical protein
VCKRRAVRAISGCKREEATGESGKLHNEKLHHLYFSPNINQGEKMNVATSWTCSTYGRDEKF